jgi:hypothetical protein
MAHFKCATLVLALTLFAAVTTAQLPKGQTNFRRYIVIPATTITPSGFTPGLTRVSEIYSLHPDGSFTFGQDNETTPRSSGTYQVRGNEVIFSTSSDKFSGTLSSDGRSISIRGNTYELSQ